MPARRGRGSRRPSRMRARPSAATVARPPRPAAPAGRGGRGGRASGRPSATVLKNGHRCGRSPSLTRTQPSEVLRSTGRRRHARSPTGRRFADAPKAAPEARRRRRQGRIHGLRPRRPSDRFEQEDDPFARPKTVRSPRGGTEGADRTPRCCPPPSRVRRCPCPRARPSPRLSGSPVGSDNQHEVPARMIDLEHRDRPATRARMARPAPGPAPVGPSPGATSRINPEPATTPRDPPSEPRARRLG